MKAFIKRFLSVILTLCMLTSAIILSSCGSEADSADTEPVTEAATESPTEAPTEPPTEEETLPDPELVDCGIVHEPEFGGVYITTTIEDFNALGFCFGDSVNVAFSNGYTLTDIPYYNGYYTRNGEPLLIGYPGYDYIKAAINNAADLWNVAGLSEDDTATVTLNAREKYWEIQNARDLSYEDVREAYESDEMFANFRSIKVGKIKENTVYRSASPCDNQHNRAPYVDRLMGEAGVRYIINLADTDEKIEGYMAADDFDSPNFAALYEDGRVLALSLNMNFESDRFRIGVLKGMTAMAEKEGPFLIHCTEGKDRTGFVCMLVGALCGASYQELVDDYMTTYDNYYHITRERDRMKYTVIVSEVFNPLLETMIGSEPDDIGSVDLERCAEKYLLSLGMGPETLEQLKEKLCGA